MKLAELEFQSGKVTEPLPPAERDDFAAALDFTNRVGELAERYNHHPEIVLEYGKVTVKWWTHTAGGVAANDCLLARETSALYGRHGR